MADHTSDPDHSETREHQRRDTPGGDASTAVPDYELAEELSLSSPDQYRALFEETRMEIVSLLLERAATTSELAVALGKPKGTVGHHLKVLEEAGLVHVVRTKRVRALEAKYYGRTARVFLFQKIGEATSASQRIMETAAKEIAEADGPDRVAMGNIRYARIPRERAWEWAQRLNDLISEFIHEPRGGDTTYGIVVGLYETTRHSLPDADESATDTTDHKTSP
ncbi:ArsR/SmtB family transcription factor [Phytoactinopolyspora endophytica]|uniref:ArsR/SmtB family transcription factor n=1 Tax=Phytoactinopolyspora endophytica TaxID=1642495 RepID=UPI00101C9D31|nr:winged helix-turn-helix domain-containing protein [Phytoactinopolyspora endophytica]